jgi:hypothetical protein
MFYSIPLKSPFACQVHGNEMMGGGTPLTQYAKQKCRKMSGLEETGQSDLLTSTFAPPPLSRPVLPLLARLT